MDDSLADKYAQIIGIYLLERAVKTNVDGVQGIFLSDDEVVKMFDDLEIAVRLS